MDKIGGIQVLNFDLVDLQLNGNKNYLQAKIKTLDFQVFIYEK